MGRNNGQTGRWKDYWLDPQTKLVQFIGKDNIPFHAVFFPAMIMGQNQPYKLVDELPANEFSILKGGNSANRKAGISISMISSNNSPQIKSVMRSPPMLLKLPIRNSLGKIFNRNAMPNCWENMAIW